MRIKLTLIGIFLSIATFAQNDNPITFRINLGSNISIPTNQNKQTSFKSAFGYTSEFVLNYKLNKKLDLQSGLGFSINRLGINYIIGFYNYNGHLRSSNFQIPISFTYKLSQKIPIGISMGPYLSFLIAASEKGTYTVEVSDTILNDNDPNIIDETQHEYKNDVKNYFNNFNVGISTQVEYDFEISSNLMGVVFFRYNYGFSNIMSDLEYNPYNVDEWKNINLLFGTGISF